MKMCGTVSTIWGSPIAGATELKDAVEFTKRWLEIGAADIEHADHDGSASAPQVYRYFSMILKEGHPKFGRPGLNKIREKMGEKPDQKFPAEWGEKAKLPEQYRAG
jgi:hypothetical protein